MTMINHKDWKEKIISLYGDKYKIRKIFDVDDSLGLGIYGYEVNDEQGNYSLYCQGYDKKDLIKYLKHKTYKEYMIYVKD